MKRLMSTMLALTFLGTSASFAVAQSASPSWSQDDGVRVVQEVQKRVSGLTEYGVFDWITFGIHGKTVVLHGYASRAMLKSAAGRAVKDIPGVSSVENMIEVLPNSPNDDRVRAQVYNRIFTSSALSKYNANAGNIRGRSVARMAGGITNDPPMGFHAIHIIVKNGHVTLYGSVLNQMDASIANMQANLAPGAFSVDNDLVIEGKGSEK
jgi:hyperosmotically inducible protein